ncbi:MAG: type II toxin-antitoxin system VapC family toxin [Prosthecobacter sp.]|uniref:type II toxin-antitoxin system VapC family toxin n=1 Tax=Prosthecobacter sp. TaxID=1965333 RepID=UPI0039012978
MKLTIDASVFVARFVEEDVFHEPCSHFIDAVRQDRLVVHAPVLLIAEVAGAVARIKKDHVRGDLAALHLRTYESLKIRQADLAFGISAAALASRHHLRGADSHYVAVARETRTTLITLDDELLALDDAGVIAVMKPLDWLRQHSV